MNQAKRLFILVVVISIISGCTAVSRGIGKLTDNKYAEPRSGTVWVVAPPQLEPPSSANKNVYISYRNISDSDIELLDEMKAAAREQGWAVVTDPTKAKYRLWASLRFFGEVEPDSGGASQARAMGWIAGAAAGSLMSAGLSNGSRPREWALIIDFVLEEYSRTPVEFTLSKGSSSSMDSGAGVGNARTSIGGSQNSGNTKSGSITQKSNYFPHGIRLSVWSNQMNMKEEESLPHILKRTRKVITKLLPI
jgi:hypothetical protein